MELVYLWVEDYKNINNQGFNFSPKFNCHYDKDKNELTIDENGDYIDNFFGENINVTAIVGKNGSGKSSIQEILQGISIINPIYGETEFTSKYIAVVYVENDSFNHNIQIKTNIDKLKFSIGELFNDKIYFLFDPLFLDAELPYNDFNEYEIASENFVATPEFDNIKEYTYVNLDYDSISKKLLQIDYSKIIDISDFIPKYLTVRPIDNTLEKSKNFMIYDYHKKPRFGNKIIEKVDDIMDNIIFTGEDFFIFSQFLYNIDNFDKKEIKKILDKIHSSKNILKVLKPFFKRIETELNFSEFKALLGEHIAIESINKEQLLEYFNYVDIEIFDCNYRSFNNLSHGEKMFFGVTVNIYYFLQNTMLENNHLLCFDEPDLALHPNWQKKYFYKIYNILMKTNKKIHFIFSTHSPFLLSDIPKQNIIFLDKDEKGNCKVVDGLNKKQQTFGANIHTLLSDSFFMEEGLMGEFAKSKINKIIRFLNGRNRFIDFPIEQIEKVVNCIGEPFLKEKLFKMYFDKFDTKKQDRIKELKAELQRLEND